MMIHVRLKTAMLALLCGAVLTACGNRDVGNAREDAQAVTPRTAQENRGGAQGSLFDIFKDRESVKVNRFLWTASLEVLNFLPIQSADPFTGIISTGYGRPPGGGRAYRATILISDPALDARSLNVALQSQSGPVSAGTQRAIEDAILTRARQLRGEARRF
jgi:hypothetical protein